MWGAEPTVQLAPPEWPVSAQADVRITDAQCLELVATRQPLCAHLGRSSEKISRLFPVSPLVT